MLSVRTEFMPKILLAPDSGGFVFCVESLTECRTESAFLHKQFHEVEDSLQDYGLFFRCPKSFFLKKLDNNYRNNL